MKNFLILLVDDEPDLLMSLEAAIKAEGYRILTADNGPKAIELTKTHKPNLILLDLMMPGMDGFAVCKQIKENPDTADTAVIFLSADKMVESKVQGLDVGAFDYMVKPFSYAEIFARLRSFMREWKYRMEITSLLEFSKNLNALEFDALMQTITESIISIFYADHFSIFVWDQKTKLLRLSASNCEMPENRRDLGLDDSPLMKKAFKTGEIVFVREFKKSPYYVEKEKTYSDDFALCVPLIMDKEVTGVLNLNGNSKGFFNEHDMAFMRLGADIIGRAIANSVQYRKIQELAVTDPLTGIYNRRFFFERLHNEWARTQRYKSKMTIVMVDLDFFKKINDTYGHECGDLVLVSAAQVLSRHLRKIDVVARYGGEEFILLLPEIPKDSAVKVAERIRNDLATTPFEWDGKNFNVTLSIGVSDSEHAGVEKPEDIIRHADENLYFAKKCGRNRVIS
ncbi:MAG: diguanylate cyclase [Nitrospinae bacterium]|nr:diguanylate cyclase [Nitrospinota bacterium]